MVLCFEVGLFSFHHTRNDYRRVAGSIHPLSWVSHALPLLLHVRLYLYLLTKVYQEKAVRDRSAPGKTDSEALTVERTGLR